jgi:hypothetical protein
VELLNYQRETGLFSSLHGLLLQGALRSAITNFVYISPEMKNKVWCLLEQYDLPVPPTPLATNGSLIQASSQVLLSKIELVFDIHFVLAGLFAG